MAKEISDREMRRPEKRVGMIFLAPPRIHDNRVRARSAGQPFVTRDALAEGRRLDENKAGWHGMVAPMRMGNEPGSLRCHGVLTTTVVELPESITPEEARLLLALKLYEEGRLSCGKAAEVAGYSKRTFMEFLGKHGISAVDCPADELAGDLNNA